tara:strand:- start:840 stop:1103 length:264 start_codon:yes stop_codon:yes gene_type:complete
MLAGSSGEPTDVRVFLSGIDILQPKIPFYSSVLIYVQIFLYFIVFFYSICMNTYGIRRLAAVIPGEASIPFERYNLTGIVRLRAAFH